MDLSGKTALVTGAGRGLGWGIARALARANARVCVTDIDDDGLKRVLSDIEADGGDAYGRRLDVAQREAFEAAPSSTPWRPRETPSR